MNFSRNRFIKHFKCTLHTDSTRSASSNPSKSAQSIRLAPVLFDPLRIPRYPIVLCHGLYGFSVRGPTSFPRFQIHYWGRLLEILRNKLGIKVIIGHVPSTGSIKQRAISLNQMLRNDESIKDCDLNFLAHSMGGLDARYLISHLMPHDHFNPVSLTTVCTPHRGSPFMDWCRVNIGVGFQESDDQFHETLNRTHEPKQTLPYSLSQPILSTNSNTSSNQINRRTRISNRFDYLPKNLLKELLLNLLDSPAYSNLSSEFLNQKFNPNTPNQPNVKYFSIAAKLGKKLNLIHPLWLPRMILDEFQKNQIIKENELLGHDGLVTIESAKWGEFLGVVENTDHWEIRGSSAFGTTNRSNRSDPINSNSKEMEVRKKSKLDSDEILDQKDKLNWLKFNRLIRTWISYNQEKNHSTQEKRKRLSEIKCMTEEILENEIELNENEIHNRQQAEQDLKVFLDEESNESSLYSLSNWIFERLPNLSSNNQQESLKLNSKKLNHHYKSTISSEFPLDDLNLLSNHSFYLNSIHHLHDHEKLFMKNNHIGMEIEIEKNENRIQMDYEIDKFDLEKVYIAICRNLYDHGF